MKVAIYHNLPSGGALRVVEAVMRRLRDRGDHVELFTSDQSARDFIDLDSLAAVVHRNPLPAAHSAQQLYPQFRAVDAFGTQVAAEIDGGQFDVVFSSSSFVTQAGEVLPYLSTPSLYFCHEYLRAVYDPPLDPPRTAKARGKQFFLRPYNLARKRFDRRAVLAATNLVTHSHFTADAVQRIYGRDCAVVHLGVDTELFQPGTAKKGDYVLSVGALHPVKGHQFVMEALATIPESDRPPFVIVGDRGEYGDTLRQLAEAGGVELTIHHNLELSKLIKLYQNTALVAAAQHAEPFGLVTLEAMATATPVVAVSEGGLAETVTNNVTGLLTPRRSDEFGQAVHTVLTDRKLATKLGATGLREAQTRWQWPRAADELLELLEQTANTRR